MFNLIKKFIKQYSDQIYIFRFEFLQLISRDNLFLNGQIKALLFSKEKSVKILFIN